MWRIYVFTVPNIFLNSLQSMKIVMHFKWYLALRGEWLPYRFVLKYFKEHVCVHDDLLPIYKNDNTIKLLPIFVMHLRNIFFKCYIHKMACSENFGRPVKTAWYSRLVTDPIFQRLHRWSLGMDNWLHPTHYNGRDNFSMLGSKLNHVSKRVTGQSQSSAW